MIKYISGVSNAALIEVAHAHHIGILLTPDTALAGPHYERIVDKYPHWAADNGCFNHPGRSLESMLTWLGKLPRKDAWFFPAPDVVGDARLTLERSMPALPRIRAAGFKAAFVAQNGIENTIIPWAQFDALFIGGDTTFKLGDQARRLTHEAKSRGMWVHMGRVNSLKRLRIANSWGCDSADGTYLRFTGPPGVAKIVHWLTTLRTETCEPSISVAA